LTDTLEIYFVDMVKFRRLGEKDVSQMGKWTGLTEAQIKELE
jgi:hypothetical protein